METLAERDTPVRPLPVVGGDLALDFANTVDDPWGPACFDHVGDAERLVGWAGLVGLLDDEAAARLRADLERDPRRAATLVRRAHALRETIRSVFGAAAEGTDVASDDWSALRTVVADAVAHAELADAHGEAVLTWAGDLDGVLRRIAYAAFERLTGDRLHRVKRCAGCPWLYLDQSKNLSRRWCSMDDCGKHEKIRRYVDRRAARRRAATTDASAS